MDLPEHLTPYRELASDWLGAGCVTDFIFSGPTYQIEISDPQSLQQYWAFIQLSDDEEHKDAFCSCEVGDDFGGCPHLTAAWMFVSDGIPLHERYKRSFWHALASELIGHPFPEAPGFSLEAPDSLLAQLRQANDEQDEETSLKFSNLDEEELEQWQMGHPTSDLEFELSIWSDFAKWGFKQQLLHTPPSTSFDGQQLQIQMGEVALAWVPSDWDFVIPTLVEMGLQEPLHGAPSGHEIGLSYFGNTGYLKLDLPDLSAAPEVKGLPLGSWLYVQGKGFFPKKMESQFPQEVLSREQIPTFLERHAAELQGQTRGIEISTRPIELRGRIWFDEEWDLHVESYLEKPGDLDGESFLMPGWVFQDQREGYFLRVGRAPFESLSQIVPRARVSEFVTTHRSWLNTQEGYRTHLSTLDTLLSHEMDEQGNLRFFAETESAGDEKPIDFGRWLYVPGEGFYSPRQRHIASSLYPGLTVEAVDLPRFIQLHKDELEALPDFFTERNPVRSIGLHITLDEREWIVVRPELDTEQSVQIFYPFLHIVGDGFYELPSEMRLPGEYGQEVSIDPGQMGTFLTEEMPHLSRYVKSVDPRLRRPEALHLHIDEVTLEEGCTLRAHYQSVHGQATIRELWERARTGEKFAFTEAGLIDVQDPRFGWLRYLREKQIEGDEVHLTTLELLRLHAFEELEGMTPELEHLLTSDTSSFVPSLKGLKSELRPYQEVGVHWLCYLYEYGLSGLLCDDMGLGKTHQAMALIAAILNRRKELKERRRYKFLVVCPTSVIYHWQDKLELFLPKVRVRTYYGPNRTLKPRGEPYDLILTSYGVLRRDRKELHKIGFDLAIYDEIQIAKNHESHIHNAIAAVQARMRLGLTGTPLENRLRELKSIFDLVLPGYMPSESRFKQEFVIPIEKQDDGHKKGLLTRFIHPFILRRKKEEVLTDLPDKTEEIARCPLLADQRALYQDVMSQGRSDIQSRLDTEETAVPYMHVFALLTRLKQICDHPAVYHKDVENYKNYTSGKWNLFVELLEEARNSRQKVVVFSQYLGMLDILESYLKEHGIQYATIRGATANRGVQIKRFHEDPECEVFVGSLQAAGVGIDLTAASVVVHYDRWWNAARENQATDRVHRIGQHQGVQVFKMVTQDTFEERIHAMIETKGRLMEELIGTDDQGLVKLLSREELMQLFQDVKE